MPQNMRPTRRDRGPIARAFDAFTVAVFFIVMIITLLAVSYVLGNGAREGPRSFGPLAAAANAISSADAFT